jgi:predicted Zn-dependent peptidase
MGSYNTPVITTFENRMVLVSIANQLNTSTVGFTVGHRNGPPWLSGGAAHLMEHLMISGAPERCIQLALEAGRSRPPTDREVLRVMNRYLGGTHGIDMNVFTEYSHTGHGHGDLLTRHALGRVFGTFAPLIREGMYDMRRMRKHWVLDQENLLIERAAVDNETGHSDEDPSQKVVETALGMLYGQNPIRWWDGPSTQELDRARLGRLKQWGMRQYVPSNMRIIIIGPNHNRAARMVRKAGLDQIPDWPAEPLVVDEAHQVPELGDVEYCELEHPGGVMTHVMMVWPTKTFTSSDLYTLQVLGDILDGRIEKVLRDENRVLPGGIYHPTVAWEGTSTHGFLEVYFASKGDRAHVDKLTTQALQVIEEIKEDYSAKLEEDVYDRQIYLKNSYLDAYRFNAIALCDQLFEYLANGDTELKRFMSYEQDVMAVTSRKIRNAANRYLPRDRRVHAVVRSVK